MTIGEVDPAVQRWLADGKHDIGRWAANGLGIYLHDKQLAVLEELDKGEATFHMLWWANRAGKTILVIVWHLHGIFYKPEIPEPRTDYEFTQWLAEDYRTLHAAPLGVLATVAHERVTEISKGTDPAQRDLEGRRREAPLGAHFRAVKERDAHGADHMVVKSLNGGSIDIRSTEGTAGRLEGRAWRRISWDEWPQQEAADKGAGIRLVLNRLQNRASDFDAKILLTGTITEDTEHIAKEWIERCEDPEDPDWWGSEASRLDNPYASRKAIGLAERQFDEEDYARSVMGTLGGVKGRLFPSFLIAPIFTNELPRFTPPVPGDGGSFVTAEARPEPRRYRDDQEERAVPRARWTQPGESPWVYLHVWDLAIAAADNIGIVARIPRDWRFGWSDVAGVRTLRPIEGVKFVEIPGSRTLTSAEIQHTIEETFLPYGGRIVLDTTDAHGKNIYRELRRAGYPVDDFTFNERDQRRVIRKDAAIHHTRVLLTEGMNLQRDKAGEILTDAEGVPIFDRSLGYGVLRLPRAWTKPRDQLSILRPDDERQRKDAAMVVLMLCSEAYRHRRARTRVNQTQHLAVFAGRGR
jgi:hypothetical protein